MPPLVTLIDYGIGNIFSVTRALEHCGAIVHLTDKPTDVLSASRLVLPGVGAFSNGMDGLMERGLVASLQEYASSGRPLLGICLGMQLLFTTSTEFGTHQGLGIIEGEIVSITPRDSLGNDLKVPHIGWGKLERPVTCQSWDLSILKYVHEGEYCYFVHTFTAVPAVESVRLADTYYGDCRVSAAVWQGNVFGCQFHPEKSGKTGLKIIKGFLET